MKKYIICILLCFTVFASKVKADSKFYLGNHVPGIYIYMDRINKKVYRQFREIYKEGTNELVYCIEPGTTLSTSSYTDETEYNPKFNISADKWEKIKKIAYYGYRYQNHTDIKWYAITQYVIWKELMPSNWTMYFVDENHNKLDNMFHSEINEIYSLVNNHKESPKLDDLYVFNYGDDIVIEDSNKLLSKYYSNIGRISSNKIDLNNELEVGEETIIDLTYNSYKKPTYHYNSDGQNILVRGDIYKKNLSFNVLITAGKVEINECDENSSNSVFIGGTYEVLDQDSEVIGEITCNQDKKCISSYIPVGSYSIRVKNLPNDYNENEYIYDFSTVNNETTIVNICSLKKVKTLKKELVKEEKEIIDEQPIASASNEKIVDIPYTYKNRFPWELVIIPLGMVLIVIYVKFIK